jgi:hypothetical protein
LEALPVNGLFTTSNVRLEAGIARRLNFSLEKELLGDLAGNARF